MQTLNYSPLGKVYAFILSWPDEELEEETGQVARVSEAQTTRPADTQLTAKPLAEQGILPSARPDEQTENER